MRRDNNGFSASERQMLIIEKLVTTTKAFLTSRELHESIPAYRPASGQEFSQNQVDAARECLRQDLNALELRGLIATHEYADPMETDVDVYASDVDLEDYGKPRNTGVSRKVKYALPRKTDENRNLRLSAEEHRALADVRRALDKGIPTISPFRADDEETFDDIDRYGIVVRYLEEAGGILTVNDLMQLLGVTSTRSARKIIEDLISVNSTFEGRIGLVEVTSDDDEGSKTTGIRLDFNRQATDSAWQQSGGGLNPQGRFEYTLAETKERLDLISEAQELDYAGDWELLWSAQEKLLEWRHVLLKVSLPPE